MSAAGAAREPADRSAPGLTLHIGAHRTATTTLQRTLQRMAEEGALGEIDYFGPHRLRPRFSLPITAWHIIVQQPMGIRRET